MMRSGSEIFGDGAIGLLFAGIRKDGVDGLTAINEGGGVTIMEARDNYFLPDSNEEAIKRGIVHHIIEDQELPSFIMKLAGRAWRDAHEHHA
jgi:two-component system, chemotaxis family, protein-glutamate methylesterase/glutaminase